MKRTIALILAMFTLCGALPCVALAADTAPSSALYPTEVVEHTDGDCPRLEKIYVLNTWEDPAAIPTADFEREGVLYTLLDMTRQDNVERETRPHTETITLESDSKDMEKILPQLAATREITTEDGYTGLLTLDTTSIKTEASGYGSSTRTVTATRSYPNLSDADVSLIPKTTEDNKRTLTLADVDWQEDNGLYHATATYTGVATSSYVKHLLIFTALMASLAVTPAHALEYDIGAPDDYLFGRPTSDETIYEQAPVNVDRSKNTALIPPGFGTPTSYLPGSGEYLTPNLVPGALDGGLIPSAGSVTYPSINSGSSWTGTATTAPFTEVTSDLYYSGGHLGTLKIPAIGLTVKVYEGTSSKALAKGAGHFENTSFFTGNTCIAAHNRGVNNHFAKIHTLEPGDRITLTTKLGTRTYSVISVEKISENDTSDTATTTDNRITLFTCVRDQREYRWCVKAVEV